MQRVDFWTADVDWAKEPEEIRGMYSLLSTNPEAALQGLKMLAERGSLAAKIYLAMHYDSTTETIAGKQEAIHWYTEAANGGSKASLYRLGILYSLKGDMRAAEEILQAGADENFPPCTYRLAMIFAKRGRQSDYDARAQLLLESASSKGHLFATRDLALRLLSGRFGAVQFVRGIYLLFILLARIAYSLLKAIRHGPRPDETVY